MINKLNLPSNIYEPSRLGNYVRREYNIDIDEENIDDILEGLQSAIDRCLDRDDAEDNMAQVHFLNF